MKIPLLCRGFRVVYSHAKSFRIIYAKYKLEIGKILRTLRERKGTVEYSTETQHFSNMLTSSTDTVIVNSGIEDNLSDNSAIKNCITRLEVKQS